jgi:hypothetical protein
VFTITGKRFLVALAAILVAVLALSSAYRAHRKFEQQRHVVALLADTTAQLRQALAGPASNENINKITGNLEAVKASGQAALADPAEHYILGAREIVRRRADAAKFAHQAAAGRQALIAHMDRASRRGETWIRDAMELKKRVERDYYDLDLSLKALDDLLFSLPDAQKRLQAQVDGSLLLEEDLRESARKRAQADAKRAHAELEKLRHLSPR